MAARDTKAALAKAAQARTRDTEQPFNTAATNSAGTGKGRITVDLGPDVYRRLKMRAAGYDKMMNEIIRELVEGWIAEHPLVD